MNEQAAAPSPNRSTRSARFLNYLHRYKNLLRQRWWVLPLTLLAGVCVQGARVWHAPPLYASYGRMIVSIKIQTPTVGSSYTEELSNFLGTQVALMRSGTVLNRAIERVRAAKPDLAYVPVDVQISVSPRTTIFNFMATGAEPQFTRAYLDACMEEYMNLKKLMRTSTSEIAVASITEQLINLERDLKKDEEDLINFQATNSVVFLQEQGNSAGNYLVQLNRKLTDMKSDYQLLKTMTLDQNLERQQNNDPKTLTGSVPEQSDAAGGLLNSDYLRTRQEILLKRAELQERSEVWRPKHPGIMALTEEITRKEKLLEIFRQQGQDQQEDRRNSMALQIKNLESDYADWEVKSLDISRRMAEYERIRAKKQSDQTLYDRLRATMQTLGVDKDVSQDTVQVLEHASAAVPARANVVKSLIIAAAIGLLIGVGLLVLLDLFDDRPTSLTDLLEVFDEPVLSQIPFEKTRRRNVEVDLIKLNDERHAFAEAYRTLRSSLLYMSTQGTPPKAILVTSAVPGDGKSLSAANLALALAQPGSRVLLIDADLRKGLLHQRFTLPPTPGLNEAISGQIQWADAVQATTVPNLFLLPRGNTARNPGEMFLRNDTGRLLKEIGSRYDYVVLDSAPVMAADDVTSLAPHVDGVVFVIRAGRTSARVARAALDLLYQRNINLLGVLFNGVEPGSTEYYYYYKYKDYYSKYDPNA